MRNRPKRAETQNTEKQNLTEPSVTALMLTLNERNNFKLIKNIMTEKKEKLSLSRNQHWKKSQVRN